MHHFNRRLRRFIIDKNVNTYSLKSNGQVIHSTCTKVRTAVQVQVKNSFNIVVENVVCKLVRRMDFVALLSL